jgi:hypothetical protein
MLRQHRHRYYSSLTKDGNHDSVFTKLKTQNTNRCKCCQQQQSSSSNNSMEAPRDGLGAEKLHARDMGAKFLVTVSSPPSPACTSVAPLAQLECSAESHGCEGVSGVSERRLRMKWIHVAGLARLSCKNMPQEMRVFMNRCKPKEGSQLRRKVSLA